YWQQQIFSGKDVPPASKHTDEDVINFVKSTPGGIGYVSASSAAAGVKVIAVK
ncbi:MAG: phosphate ABC transporter substrate-binding protein, partial [Phycisphaerae bacterium]|nr:phosphate ABC transporter substrate-binding protein [Gemmatimonadaceae bacterium]